MWPFPKKPPSQQVEDLANRYKHSPIDLFFEAFILDVIGVLPSDRESKLEKINLHIALKTQATGWRGAVRESLHLSDTIDVAILDLWYRNREIGEKADVVYEPEQFARDFADKYFAEGSLVDLWPGDSLQQAKWRIAKYQSGS